jgi:hypothetical protein
MQWSVDIISFLKKKSWLEINSRVARINLLYLYWERRNIGGLYGQPASCLVKIYDVFALCPLLLLAVRWRSYLSCLGHGNSFNVGVAGRHTPRSRHWACKGTALAGALAKEKITLPAAHVLAKLCINWNKNLANLSSLVQICKDVHKNLMNFSLAQQKVGLSHNHSKIEARVQLAIS